MKPLKNILEFTQAKKLEKKVLPKEDNPFAHAEADKEFIAKHPAERVEDANGNGDDVFKASKVKAVDIPAEKHGYDQKKSEDVNERKLTMKEIAKRKEIADAIKRDHPDYSDEKKMAIATAKAKEVSEAVDAKAKAKENVDFHHSQATDYASEINKMLGQYKKDAGKNKHLGDWHAGDMAQVHSNLRQAHDTLKYACMGVKPPEPVKVHEQFDSIMEAVEAHKAQEEDQLVESYAAVLEQAYAALTTEEDKQKFMAILESEEAYDELMDIIEKAEQQ